MTVADILKWMLDVRLRLLQWCVLVAVVATGLGVSAQGQNSGIRGNSYKPATPFADLSRRSRDSSPLGTVDGGVNQSIGLEAEGQFNAVQSSSAGLDQLQASPGGGGHRSALGSSVKFGVEPGTRNSIPSQAYTRPTYLQPSSGASPMATRLAPMQAATALSRSGSARRGLGASTGISSVQHVPETIRRAGNYHSFASTMRGTGSAARVGAASSDLPAISDQQAAQSPFERLGDPFLGASATGFESLGTKSAFARPCGDACTFRSSAGNGLSNGASLRTREHLGEKLETKVPESDTKVQSGQELKLP